MSDEFDELLAETGITFTPPAGFSPYPVHSCAFRYHRGYRHAGGVEVRLRIDSLQRLKAGMNGFLPSNFSESAFVAGITNLSGGEARVRQWEEKAAREMFNADWIRTAYFDPADPHFAPDHQHAVVHYFHRKDIADVYLIALYRPGDKDAEWLALGERPPVWYPPFPQPQPAQSAPAGESAPQHSEAFLDPWRRAVALMEGRINLDGVRLPAPSDEDRQRLAAAIPLFEQAAQVEPGNAGPALFIGKIHERLGDLQASLASIRKAHAIAPDHSTTILELGGMLGRCGMHAEAIEVLSPGSTVHPRHPVIQFNLGLSLLLAGYPWQAIRAFEKLVELEPGRQQNRQLLALANDVADGKRPAPKTEAELVALL